MNKIHNKQDLKETQALYFSLRNLLGAIKSQTSLIEQMAQDENKNELINLAFQIDAIADAAISKLKVFEA